MILLLTSNKVNNIQHTTITTPVIIRNILSIQEELILHMNTETKIQYAQASTIGVEKAKISSNLYFILHLST